MIYFFGRKKVLVFRFHIFVVVWLTSSMHGLNKMLFNCILRCYLFYETDCVMVIFESVCSEWKQTVRCLIPFNWSTVVDICQKINRQISAMVTRDLGLKNTIWPSGVVIVSCHRTLVYSTLRRAFKTAEVNICHVGCWEIWYSKSDHFNVQCQKYACTEKHLQRDSMRQDIPIRFKSEQCYFNIIISLCYFSFVDILNLRFYLYILVTFRLHKNNVLKTEKFFFFLSFFFAYRLKCSQNDPCSNVKSLLFTRRR